MAQVGEASTKRSLVRLGTRGSPLALAQAREVCARLLAAHSGLTAAEVEIVVIRTTGDRIQDRTLAESGGKGLFTKEIEEALIAGSIDLAVHSMKDMPTLLPSGLMIATLLPREDPRDALIARGIGSIAALPKAAHVGTASLRRRAQLLYRRPDVRVDNLRGNVETRLNKVASGAFDATFLALAGLKRLGLAAHVSAVLDPSEMLPAVAQGAIGIECREADRRVRDLLAALDHGPTATCVSAERALLEALDGSCRTPIAALAELDGEGDVVLRAAIARPDGSELIETRRRGAVTDAVRLGADAGAELKRRGGPGFFAD